MYPEGMEKLPRKPTISNPILGRIVGVLWDISVTLVTVIAFPVYAWHSAQALVLISPMYWPIVVPLLVLAVASVLFGVLWSFRRFHLPGGDDDAS